jgi:hypothetical protein
LREALLHTYGDDIAAMPRAITIASPRLTAAAKTSRFSGHHHPVPREAFASFLPPTL